METATYRPLPPILYRYPGRRFFEKPLPPLPDGSFDIEIELVPNAASAGYALRCCDRSIASVTAQQTTLDFVTRVFSPFIKRQHHVFSLNGL
jgi:hypothetical protein